MFHESPTATADMDVLPGVLGRSFDRLRTGSPCDVLLKYASDPIPRCRGTVSRWHTLLHGLATAIEDPCSPAEGGSPLRYDKLQGIFEM
jgi:hypothetical protein